MRRAAAAVSNEKTVCKDCKRPLLECKCPDDTPWFLAWLCGDGGGDATGIDWFED